MVAGELCLDASHRRRHSHSDTDAHTNTHTHICIRATRSEAFAKPAAIPLTHVGFLLNNFRQNTSLLGKAKCSESIRKNCVEIWLKLAKINRVRFLFSFVTGWFSFVAFLWSGIGAYLSLTVESAWKTHARQYLQKKKNVKLGEVTSRF